MVVAKEKTRSGGQLTEVTITVDHDGKVDAKHSIKVGHKFKLFVHSTGVVRLDLLLDGDGITRSDLY